MNHAEPTITTTAADPKVPASFQLPRAMLDALKLRAAGQHRTVSSHLRALVANDLKHTHTHTR